MAYDIQNFTVTHLGNQALTVPVVKLSLQIVDSQTGAVLNDLTGANAVNFPQILGTLTQAQREEFLRNTVQWLISVKLGL